MVYLCGQTFFFDFGHIDIPLEVFQINSPHAAICTQGFVNTLCYFYSHYLAAFLIFKQYAFNYTIFMLLDTMVIFLLLSSVITLPRKPSKNKKIVARKGFTCRSMCKGIYDLCSVSADSITKQMLCFNSKLLCNYNCVENKWNKFQLKRQTKVVKKSKFEKHLRE